MPIISDTLLHHLIVTTIQALTHILLVPINLVYDCTFTSLGTQRPLTHIRTGQLLCGDTKMTKRHEC